MGAVGTTSTRRPEVRGWPSADRLPGPPHQFHDLAEDLVEALGGKRPLRVCDFQPSGGRALVEGADSARWPGRLWMGKWFRRRTPGFGSFRITWGGLRPLHIRARGQPRARPVGSSRRAQRARLDHGSTWSVAPRELRPRRHAHGVRDHRSPRHRRGGRGGRHTDPAIRALLGRGGRRIRGPRFEACPAGPRTAEEPSGGAGEVACRARPLLPGDQPGYTGSGPCAESEPR